MKIDVIVAEIGSTTTIVNAFNGMDSAKPLFAGQGQAYTTVLEGDVTIGLSNALSDLAKKMAVNKIEYTKMFATSSAAGGLKMTVHGLVYDMTVKAATEAALGAGAIIKNVTAGKLRRTDLQKINQADANIILIAGGLDYGERETALYNFEKIAAANPQIPVIYAGNIENQEEIKLIAEDFGVKVFIVENVYPKVDQLNVEPARVVIQDVFEEHIIYAPGMSTVKTMVNGLIIPTPGAVMEAAKLFREAIGDVVVFDIGGATTDVHSVTDGTSEINRILTSPEPTAKRTVEGDIGLFVNLLNVAEKIGLENLTKEFPDVTTLISNAKPIPEGDYEKKFIERLTQEALKIGLSRHAGRIRSYFTPSGKRMVAEGKDLTGVSYIIGTGGALTRLPNRVKILENIKKLAGQQELYPGKDAKVLIDNDYIMASLGVLSKDYKEQALILLKNSLYRR